MDHNVTLLADLVVLVVWIRGGLTPKTLRARLGPLFRRGALRARSGRAPDALRVGPLGPSRAGRHIRHAARSGSVPIRRAARSGSVP